MKRKVIVVDEKGARLEESGTELADMQKIVGGYIERWPYGPRTPTVYVNEEGMLKAQPVFARLDGVVVWGPILAVVGSRDLTEKDLEKFKARLEVLSA